MLAIANSGNQTRRVSCHSTLVWLMRRARSGGIENYGVERKELRNSVGKVEEREKAVPCQDGHRQWKMEVELLVMK